MEIVERISDQISDRSKKLTDTDNTGFITRLVTA